MKVYWLFLLFLSIGLFTYSCGTGSTPTYTLETIVSPSDGGTISPSGGEYDKGEEVRLVSKSSEHWVFEGWYGYNSSSSSLTIVMDSDKRIIGNFVKRDYPLNITIEGEGTVQEAIIQSKSTEYPHGTVVELRPIPSEGWSFVKWGGYLSGKQIPNQITVNEEKNVTAVFEKSFYLHSNGITIMCPNTNVGDKGFVDGVEYEAVDRDLLNQRFEEGINLTELCTSLVTDMSSLFQGRSSFYNQNISNWDVSNVTDMSRMFYDFSFNQAISDWDVSKVGNMSHMFHNSSFNQPIGKWNVSRVTDMSYMFSNSPFDQPIGSWNVEMVMSMKYMFGGTQSKSRFNQPIGDWDVSNVKDMSFMFGGDFYGSEFNQDIGDWDVSNVTNMEKMFYRSPFNQDIGSWNVNSVINMESIFENTPFNQNIASWRVSSVTNMRRMFHNSSFNKPIGSWDVSNVIDMESMFSNSDILDPSVKSPFDQDIGDWDVSSVSNMRFMFSESLFNQSIANWDVSNVSDMSVMFRGSAFNQPIGSWEVGRVENMDFMFYDSSFSKSISNWCVFRIETEPEEFSYGSPLTEENKPIWGTCPDN